MRSIKITMTMAFMLYLTISAVAQEMPVGYNPFVTGNLDDVLKLSETTVIESSYHEYSLTGDANYTSPSTFVWYVENGTLGTYDAASDTWTPATVGGAISGGEYLELEGSLLNTSGIWVRWNDGTGGSTGYIAVYERSADNCVFDQQITGYKHRILVPPEVWFLVDAREECSDQIYSITAQLNEVDAGSFPYVLTYSYPDANGSIVETDTTLVAGDLDGANQLNWDLNAVLDLDAAIDEVYNINLLSLRDAFGSEGKIAPLGAVAGQYQSISISILHLPQTGGMMMN